jgi:hypothetical protein
VYLLDSVLEPGNYQDDICVGCSTCAYSKWRCFGLTNCTPDPFKSHLIKGVNTSRGLYLDWKARALYSFLKVKWLKHADA